MDGSVIIGVNLDTSQVSSAAAALESQLSSLGVRLNQALYQPVEEMGIGEGIMNTINGIAEAITASSANVMASMSAMAASAIQGFTSAPWSSAGNNAMSALNSGVSGGSGAVISSVKSIASQAQSAFSGGSWSSIGYSMMSGVASGILSAGREIVAAIQKVSSDAENAVKGYYKIQSPSALMRDEVGVMISRGIAEGILGGSSYVNSAMEELYSPLRGSYREAGQADSRTLTQNIYLRDSDSSPYLTAKRIKKESEAAFRR